MGSIQPFNEKSERTLVNKIHCFHFCTPNAQNTEYSN